MLAQDDRDEHRPHRMTHDPGLRPARLESVSFCSACGKTWPTRFGAGAETVRIVSKESG